MKYETIVFSEREAIGTIVLNRPESLNAFDVTMRKELANLVQELQKNKSIRVVIITGSGRAFCAGGDVKVQSSAVGKVDSLARLENIRLMNKAILSLKELQKPVIAAINGPAAGAGFSLALACDIRIASDQAKFRMVFVKTGLHPDSGATYFLPRLVGTGKACELIFTGDAIDAEEAEEVGIVNKVVKAADLEHTVNELALKMAKGPPIPIKMAKGLIYKSLTMDLPSVLEWEALAQGVCLQTKDHQEGLAAFLEKREPSFQGV